MMTIDIETAYEQQGIIEIDYENLSGKRTKLHICDLEKQKNDDLLAFCIESQKDLTFNANRIHHMKWIWKYIFNQDDVAPQKGIYVFACRGDNHLVFEVYQLNKGDKFYKYFEGEFAHSDGWLGVDPLAFHYVYPYTEKAIDWVPIDSMSIFKDSLPSYDRDHLFRLFAIKTASGIVYAMRDYYSFFSNPTLNSDLIPYHSTDEDEPLNNIIAVHNFVEFTEGDHSVFWKTFHKLKNDVTE